MNKIFVLATSSLIGLVALAGLAPPAAGGPGEPPAPPKKKGERGPGEDLRKAHDLLRRIRADNRPTGRPEERLHDWTERATRLYREGVRAFEAGDHRRAHEYGTAAHDLARAVDHARNASLYEGPDSDLPSPPGAADPDGDDRTRRDLRRAHDRIRDGLDDAAEADGRFYLDAARDLYNAARRDAVAGRSERAGELARAAEAMTHVPEHLAHAEGLDRPEPPKRKGERIERKRPPRPFDAPDPKEAPRDGELPPPL